LEEQQKEKEAKEKEMQRLREAERRKRARDAQSVNLTSQSEIMACIEKSFNDVASPPPDPGLLNGMQTPRTSDEVL